LYATPGYGNDLGLFDQSYQKKPSYYAILDELKATQSPLPGALNKFSPADKATNQPISLTLSWGTSAGATSYEYCLDTSPNNNCDTSWISTGASTSVAVNLLPLTTYSWQVRARNASGLTHANQGAWGSFTTESDWSTNFASVTDPADAGIFSPDSSVSLDTTNVNSGGKSVKISGTIGQASSGLNLNFQTWGLIGYASLDLSQKTIHYEIYLPADSPLDELNFYIFTNDQYVVIRHVADPQKGVWTTYSVDISEVIALKSWHAASWMTSGLSDDEVVNLIKNSQCITVMGWVSSAHTPAPSYFLLDRLGWEASAP